MTGKELTVQNPDRLSRALQRPGDGVEVAAAIHVPLHVAIWSGSGKASKAAGGPRFLLTVLGIRLRVESGSHAACKLGTDVNRRVLELP